MYTLFSDQIKIPEKYAIYNVLVVWKFTAIKTMQVVTGITCTVKRGNTFIFAKINEICNDETFLQLFSY